MKKFLLGNVDVVGGVFVGICCMALSVVATTVYFTQNWVSYDESTDLCIQAIIQNELNANY